MNLTLFQKMPWLVTLLPLSPSITQLVCTSVMGQNVSCLLLLLLFSCTVANFAKNYPKKIQEFLSSNVLNSYFYIIESFHIYLFFQVIPKMSLF